MIKKLAAVLVFTLLGLHTEGATLGDKLRVLSFNLNNARVETPGTPGSELAQDIRMLLEKADADVICVQGALDWENCERICKLKPGLQVLTCSAFENSPQVALLARTGAVLSWPDEVPPGGSFAMGILQSGTRRLAVFSAQPAAGTNAAVMTERLVAEVKKLLKFPQNRPDSILITGAGITRTTVLTDNTFQTVAAEPRAEGSPDFWMMNGGFLTRPRTIPLKGLKTAAALCDFDTSSSFASKFAYQTPLLFPGETLASLQPPAPAATVPAPDHTRLIWSVSIGGIILLFLLFVLRSRPRPSNALQLVANGNSTGMLPVDDPVRSNLLAWLKSAFLQRLLSQRQQLLNDEAEATRRTMVIEEKLSNLQSALQTRISAYEARIERLEQELTAATLDNRELIRAQIELLKEKVAKAKEEHALGRN